MPPQLANRTVQPKKSGSFFSFFSPCGSNFVVKDEGLEKREHSPQTSFSISDSDISSRSNSCSTIVSSPSQSFISETFSEIKEESPIDFLPANEVEDMKNFILHIWSTLDSTAQRSKVYKTFYAMSNEAKEYLEFFSCLGLKSEAVADILSPESIANAIMTAAICLKTEGNLRLDEAKSDQKKETTKTDHNDAVVKIGTAINNHPRVGSYTDLKSIFNSKTIEAVNHHKAAVFEQVKKKFTTPHYTIVLPKSNESNKDVLEAWQNSNKDVMRSVLFLFDREAKPQHHKSTFFTQNPGQWKVYLKEKDQKVQVRPLHKIHGKSLKSQKDLEQHIPLLLDMLMMRNLFTTDAPLNFPGKPTKNYVAKNYAEKIIGYCKEFIDYLPALVEQEQTVLRGANFTGTFVLAMR